MKKIIILGGGISGLSLLWYLRQRPGYDVTLLEKSSRVGGWICSLKKKGFLFERGPHSCRSKGQGKATLQLLEELGLQSQVVQGNPAAQQRYLYLNGCLQKVPSNLLSLLFSPLTRPILPKLFKEWKILSGQEEDESIDDFFARRFGIEAVETFLDPLVTGIYAGDIHQLSAKSCFPQLFQWEREYGSILKGALFNRFVKKEEVLSPFVKQMHNSSLFSFKEGMETLPKALAKHLKKHILTNHEVTELRFYPTGIEVQLMNGQVLWADQVYSSLPAQALSPLIRTHHKKAGELLDSIPTASVAVVSLGYKRKLLPREGFGYLIPSKERQDILGMIWDSCVFSEQNSSAEETRLTVMIGGTRLPNFSHWNESDFLNLALKAVSNHLK